MRDYRDSRYRQYGEGQVFVMRRNIFLLVVAFALVAVACSGDDSDSVETTTASTQAPTTTSLTTTTEAPSEGGAVFAMVEVGVGAAEQYVVIQNQGDATGSLQGFAICQAGMYHSFGDIEVAPGSLVVVSLGGNVPDIAAAATETVMADIGLISADDGEMGLYSVSDFGNSDAIVAYIEWGNSGHRRSSVAVDAGIWNSGDFVATTSTTSVLVATPPTDGAEDWDAG